MPNPYPDKENTLLETAKKICSAIGPDSLVLVGGLAVGAWGFVRGTKDVDFSTNKRPSDIEARLQEFGATFRIVRGGPEDPIPWSVNGSIAGVPFNILPPLEGLSVEEGIPLEGLNIRVCRLEDLVRLKFYAGGSQDILDIARLAKVRPDLLPYAEEQADRYGIRKMFDSFLSDRPRLSERFPSSGIFGTETDSDSEPK